MLRFYLHFGEFVPLAHLIRHGVENHAVPPSLKGKALHPSGVRGP